MSVKPIPGGQRTTRRAGLNLGLIGLLAVLLVLLGLSLVVGSKHIPVDQVVHALSHPDPADGDTVIVRSGRVPRTALGLLTGIALGLAGTVMQAVTRNPLADPGLLGINAGAALAVVGGIALLGATSLTQYVWFALAGAALAAVAVFLIGSLGPRGATPVSLALAGVAITALVSGFTSLLLLRDVNAFNEYRHWTVGSVDGRQPAVIVEVVPFIAAGSLLALALGRSLNVMSLGDDVARGLGQRVGRSRVLSAMAVVLLCGSATAAAGPIVFLGLAVPHLARLITGPDYRWVLPYSLLLAPILMIGSDILGRIVARPAELPVGVVTALIGAPVFLLLVRYRRASEL